MATFVAGIVAAIAHPTLEKLAAKGKYKLPRLVDYGGDTSKRWYIIYEVWDSVEERMRRIRISQQINQFVSRLERRQAASELMHQIATFLKSGKVEFDSAVKTRTPRTVPDAITEYINQMPKSADNATVRYYLALADHIKAAGLSGIPLKKFNLDSIISLRGHLRGRDLAGKTINNYLKNLSTVFKFCTQAGHLDSNPLDRFKYEKVETGEIHLPYTIEQIKILRQLGASRPDYLLFMDFCLYTLARPWDEIRRIRIQDIKADTIYFPAKNVKNSKAKYVEIVPPLQRIIEARGLRAMDPDWYVFGSQFQPGPELVAEDHYYDLNVRYLKEMALFGKGYNVYSFKATGAIHMRLAGVSIYTLKQMMGHADTSQTEEYFKNLGVIINADHSLSKVPDFSI